ncbi:porin [Dysgonomonas sp. ZJ709]|uniref:porin n=1 Tax=Dysgonomonas sp. ZJ709 TaxID=2709797 RepID=UPI0013EB7CEA|nr:porin [Dysgonomonas sp. ZJ709]
MKKSFFMLLLSMLCTLSYGQDTNSELLKKLVEKEILTQDEADEIQRESTLEKQEDTFTKTTEKIKETFSSPYAQFGGYGLFLYKYNDIAKVKHTAEPRVIFLSLSGELGSNIRYYILGEVVDPMLFEFYGEWTPVKAFGLKAGQMKTPLSMENQISLTGLETVSYTRSVSNLTGMAGDVLVGRLTNNNAGRDIGIRVAGSTKNDLLCYALGLYQGTGINTAENNNSKDLAGSLIFQPIKGFRIGGSAYWGEAHYTKPGDTEIGDHVRNRWVLSSEYKSDRFYARTEWITGNDGGTDKEGLYGTALWYFIPKKFNTVAKVDYYNRNKDVNSEVMDYTLAVNYYFYKQCRLQLNYVYSDYSKDWETRNTNLVLGQLQVVF